VTANKSDKSAQIEREIVARHVKLGATAEVQLSGAARYRGNGADIDVYAFGPDAAPLDGEGFAMLDR
jgi:hypothetical protein